MAWLFEMHFVFTLFLTAQFIPLARAEYRAFRLGISNGTQTREVISTLDNLQYPQYYPVEANEKVNYIDSWTCPGRTSDFLPPCAAPLRAPANSKPSSTASPASAVPK